MDDALTKTIAHIQTVIKKQGGNEALQARVLAVLQSAFSSQMYMTSVETSIDKIFEDKKVNLHDIPEFIQALISLNKALQKALNCFTMADEQTCKYFYYAVLHYYTIKYDHLFFEEFSVDHLATVYFNLWKLVHENPKKIKSSGFCCRLG